MKIKNWVLPLTIFAVFWGTIGVSMATGVWQAKQNASDIQVMSTGDLKGWMTLEDISGYTKVPPRELAKALGIPENTPQNQKLKDIAAEKGVETDELKERLNRYFDSGTDSGQPVVKPQSSTNEANTGTVKPVEGTVNASTDSETKNNEVKNNQANNNDSKTNVSGNENKISPVTGTPKSSGNSSEIGSAAGGNANTTTGGVNLGDRNGDSGTRGEGSGSEETIKGRMSLSEVEKATGVPVQFICDKVGLPADVDKNVPMRDLTGKYNFEVSEVRDAAASYKK